MSTLGLRQPDVPTEAGRAIRAGGVYGAALREIRDNADNWGALPSQAGMVYGDVINGTKEVFSIAGYYSGKPALYDPGMAVPLVDAFNGWNGMAASLFGYFGGSEIVATAGKTRDVVGKRMGQSVQVIAGTNFCGSFTKLGANTLTVIAHFRTLPAALRAMIGILGIVTGGFFGLMFIAIIALTYYSHKESNRFSETFKEVLQDTVRQLRLDPNSAKFESVWEQTNPEKMYEALNVVLREHGILDGELAESVQEELDRRLDKRQLEIEIQDWARDVLEGHGLSDMVAHDGKSVRSIIDSGDTSEILYEMRAYLERDSIGNRYALEDLDDLEARWNDRVNFVHAFERATKAEVVEEIATGVLVSDQIEARKEIDAIRARLSDIFDAPALEGDVLFDQIVEHRRMLLEKGDPSSRDAIIELNDLEDRLISQESRLVRNPSKVVTHMLRKWKVERNWNIALAVVAAVALVVLIATFVAPIFITAPILSVVLSFAWIALSVAFLVFDGKSFIEAYKGAQGGKRDAIIMAITGFALVGVSVASVILTMGSAAIAPIIFLAIAGGIVGLIHIASVIRVAQRTADERRKRLEAAAAKKGEVDLKHGLLSPAKMLVPNVKTA